MIATEKITHALSALFAYLNLAIDVGTLPKEFADKQKKSVLKLLESVHKEPEKSMEMANKVIEEMNAHLKVPYPALANDTLENCVKSEIVAFEHYLFQELKANHLTLEQEAPLFNDSLRLWEKVGVSLSADAAESAFSALVEKANRLLPENEKYPMPVETN